jgi:hypothetical protein
MKKLTVYLALILGGTCLVAKGGGRMHHYHGGMVCNDAMCVPRRVTFGYTPTTWRRFPTNEEPSAPEAAPEQLPTPAAEPPAGESSPFRGPAITPEDAPLMPTEPGLEPPGGETPLIPPFDDAAPAPPSTSPPPSSAAPSSIPPLTSPSSVPPSALPDMPAELNAPAGDSDPPPAMPDDDPFKDDPVAPLPSPGSSTRHLPEGPGQLLSGQPAAVRWQSNVRTTAGALAGASLSGPKLGGAVSLGAVSNGEEAEPARLPAGELAPGMRAQPLPAQETMRPNPLRAGGNTTMTEAIVPTVGLSTSSESFAAPAEPLKPNPLRAGN